ncbi:MAG: carboxypeptidase regulatory-like domain-containing protein [Anaerolineae bacterium]|nr:carboxypeptidase regulatory-like domain-containing protein [Anaerolineae bacterium]
MTKLTLLLLLLLVLGAVLFGGAGLGIAYLETKTLQGTVLDEQGAAIPQAAVTLAGRSALSDARGAFQIQFPRGEWELRAFADGFQTAVQPIDASDFWRQNFSASLTLSPREWRARVVTGDPAQPLANVHVELDGEILTTNADGEFVARGVRSGAQLKISRPGYRSVSVTVQSADDSAQVTTIALAPAELRVTVVDASNQKPLPGVRVQANGSSVNTDVNGQVVLFALTEGTEISARAPGYSQVIAPAENGADLTLALEPTTLDGRIVDQNTREPVANAVLLYGSAGGETANALSSSPQGTFTIEDFSAVPKLYIKKPGYLLGEFDLTQGGDREFSLTPFRARGIHLHFGINQADAERILTQFKDTEMNAVVFDVKEDPGYLLWDSQAPLALAIGAYLEREYTANDQVETCRQFKLYCIARVTIFKDNLLAQSRPDLALHNVAGGLLYENAAYWTDPAESEVQDYHITLAQELAAMGFDEVQYDYVRYPGTQNILSSEFGDAAYRVGNIKTFLTRAADALRPTTAFFSGDVFGLTTATEDEQGIGQVWEEIVPPFDYVSPMMYPSTWRYATGLWGAAFDIANCSDAYVCPYEIMRYGTLAAQKRTTNNWTLVRPWLQAYQMGLADMLKQAQGSDDANSSGYLFWNNAGVYPDGLFKKN